MWIFTHTGMVSLVEHPDDASLVIARSPSLPALLNLFPSVTPSHIPFTSMSYQATIPRPLAVDAMYSAVQAIDYSQFRQSITDTRYRDNCLNIWQEICDQGIENESDLEELNRICAELDKAEQRTRFPATPS